MMKSSLLFVFLFINFSSGQPIDEIASESTREEAKESQTEEILNQDNVQNLANGQPMDNVQESTQEQLMNTEVILDPSVRSPHDGRYPYDRDRYDRDRYDRDRYDRDRYDRDRYDRRPGNTEVVVIPGGSRGGHRPGGGVEVVVVDPSRGGYDRRPEVVVVEPGRGGYDRRPEVVVVPGNGDRFGDRDRYDRDRFGNPIRGVGGSTVIGSAIRGIAQGIAQG